MNELTRRSFIQTTGATAAWAAFGRHLCAAEPSPLPAKPNVILIITDDQGYGDVAAHGNTMIQTPQMDRLWSESVRLTNFHVDPTCAPSRSSLMSGRYSNRTGIWHTIMGRSLMAGGELTLAEIFKANGYRTGMFGKWHLGDNYPLRPEDQGFHYVVRHGGGGVGQGPDWWGNDYFDDTYWRNGKPEPFMGYLYPVDAQLNRKVFGRLASKEHFDYVTGLEGLENEANERIMFGLPEETKAKYRPWALVGVAIAAVLFALGIRFIVRAYREKDVEAKAKELDRPASARSVYSRWMPWLLLTPALVSIVLWAYYPLGRGSVMAFQDYRIVGKSSWVGLDNFITIFYTRDFWVYLSKTFKYATWSLGLCFFTPIVLAILLSEVPKGKTFFRTVFFLPQVSSGLVVLFIWKLMYNPTEYGLLNQLLLGMNKLPIGLVIAMKLIVVSTVAALLYVVFRIALKQEHETRKSEVFFLVLAFGGVGLILMSLLADGGVLAWKDTYTGMFKRLGLLAIVGLGLYSAVWLGFKRTAETWQVRVCQAGVALGGMVLAGGLYAWATGLIADGASLVGVLEAMGRWIVWPFTRFGFTPQKWLNDVKWAMICVILPGMWASAGIGSLIYLAALKNVDEEIYEAAEIDGCGFFHKMWYITIPYLKPLIIINFVGAFIGTFRAMGNIFAMTGGGPGDETTVLSLAIWYEAFAFLRFGLATAMAWVLGLMLIGFTVYQLRILKKVEFRRAESF